MINSHIERLLKVVKSEYQYLYTANLHIKSDFFKQCRTFKDHIFKQLARVNPLLNTQSRVKMKEH